MIWLVAMIEVHLIWQLCDMVKVSRCLNQLVGGTTQIKW
jgi:hypothetical protein